MAHKPKVVKDTAERWLLTYADLMNLLLILFIILYTFSKVDAGKYQQVAGSLKSVLGQSTGSVIGKGNGGSKTIGLEGKSTEEANGIKSEAEQLTDVKKQITEIIKKEGLQGSVIVQSQERGIVISVRDKVLFKSGSAVIEPNSISTIEKIGKVLLQIDGKQIRIEGNTDTDPISNSKFIDNQELSTARANSVWRIFVKSVGLSPETMSSIGYGEYRPIAPNNNLENKAKNRRVDITVLKDKYDASEASTIEQLQ